MTKYRDRLRNKCHQADGNRSNGFYCVVCPCISLSELKDRIRNGDRIPAPLAFVLWLASFIQRFGMWLRLRKTPVKVPAYVISYGNITAGGVGKTPAVIERAQKELAAGKQVAILTRGYGAAPVQEPLLLAPSISTSVLSVHPVHSLHPSPSVRSLSQKYGDEAALIAKRVPGVWIVRSADRVAGARAAVAEGCEVIIMDDGFQAVALARDENILLVDATNPFGNGYLVPRGVLREPLSAMQRATEIMVTRCDHAQDALYAIEQTIKQHAPDVHITRTRHAPTGLWRVCDGSEVPLSFLQNTDIRVVCGIGNPNAFCHTLRELGATITETHSLPDHGKIPDCFLNATVPTIMTEKDAMRITDVCSSNVYALAIILDEYDTGSSVEGFLSQH